MRQRVGLFLTFLLTLLFLPNHSPLFAATEGGPLPDTDGGYLISVIVGVVLLVGGIILLRLQKHL